jgi:hypothetical protein
LERELSLVVGSKGRGSTGEGGGVVAPNAVGERAVQLFAPSPEPRGVNFVFLFEDGA